MLTIFTIFLGVLAFIGYNAIKNYAGQIAKDAADAYINDLKKQEAAKERPDNKTLSPSEAAVRDDQIMPEESKL